MTTDKSRWWVITNLTNLYPRNHFPSPDYTLSFHIGLTMRIKSNESRRSSELGPLVEVFRRQEQAHERLDQGVEAEEFQAVGMLLRESLLSLVGVVRRRVDLRRTWSGLRRRTFLDRASMAVAADERDYR